MAIQWYPGHMAKARRALEGSMPAQDVVIEVLDARLPMSSQNPVLAELRGKKPCIRVLAKSDLADPRATDAWLRRLEVDGAVDHAGQVVTMASTTERGADPSARLLQLCARLAPRPAGGLARTRVIVVGIPNVGKSTLVNMLAKRRVAKVGDAPAVTKATQQVELPNGILLSDNPGILWPKLDDEGAAWRLALAGALPDTAHDFESVASSAARLLLDRYPALLAARYGVSPAADSPSALLLGIGRRRGCVRSGGVIDTHKAADILIHDFRAGLLGRISLELPQEHPPEEHPPGSPQEPSPDRPGRSPRPLKSV